MKKFLLATTVLCVSAFSSFAETIEVEMLNKNEAGDKMVFSRELIRAEVGDVVRFVPTDRAHNAQSVKGAFPNGQKPFKGKMNKAVEFTATAPGITAVVCLPHQTMGMVALIIVDNNLDNADQVLKAKIPGKKAKEKIRALIEEAHATQPVIAIPEDQNS